ncbi:MAG: hypothetical protein U9O98_05360 [Asgard group archaeon]|nr:hypothetical protein [Asgard group archaeon]
MISITKELEPLLQDLFKSRKTTEIPLKEVADILDVSPNDLRTIIKREQFSDQYKLVKAKNGTEYIKRIPNELKDGLTISAGLSLQWDNIGGCPCFTCHELERCDVGNPISSVDCPIFQKWLFNKDEELDEEAPKRA